MHRYAAAVSDRRRGHSLLEVLVASALMAVALVPALRLMRDGLGMARKVESRELLTTFCTSKLEEHLALVSAGWQTGNYSGDFSAEGHPNLRFGVTRSDSGGDGGISDQLMAVVATAWDDLDGDGSLDDGEPVVVLGSKVAKLASYQSDWRYPPQEMDEIRAALEKNGVPCEHRVLDSDFGHGAFIYDSEGAGKAISTFLR